jgi:hypothetical protein
MSLSSQYPYYGPLGSGNYNVSLAFFGPASEISKSLGLNSSTGLVLPNTDYIQKFAEGDLGISDGFIKNMLAKNFNSPIAQKDEKVFRQFAKINKIEIDDINKYKKGNKFVFPKSEIKIPDEFNMTGFKAFEKTTLQSIFETQKPFVEIVGIAIGSVAKAEDVIARVMPFFGNPLTVKSRKPVGNAGAGSSRPKAIGYKGAAETKSSLQKLEAIRTKDDIQVNTNNTNPNNIDLTINTQTDNQSGITSTSWKIISTVYSTGTFDPNVEYNYTYINLPADKELPDVLEPDLEDTDSYQNYKPKSIIFGIYDSKGAPLDPNEFLTTIGLQGNNRVDVITPFKKADWILRSPKWKLPEGVIEWPSFGTPNFIWEKNTIFGRETKVSKKSPGVGWSIRKYKPNDRNVITKEIAIPNDPVIQSFDATESTQYKNYYSDIIDIGLNNYEISTQEKIKRKSELTNQLDIRPQVELTFSWGHCKSSVYKDKFPDTMKKSYKPYQIFIPEAAKDENLIKLANQKGEKAGLVWVDPEADYDLKIIRVDPVTNIEYSEAKDKPELNASIKQFVKNKVKFSFSNGATFSLSISKNNQDDKVYENINEFIYENWNYDSKTGKILNNNEYAIKVWSDLAPSRLTTSNNFSWKVEKEPLKIKIPGVFGSFSVKLQEPDYYSITKRDDVWYYTSTANNFIRNGEVKLGDGTSVFIEDGKITKWFYLNQTFTGSNTGLNLPTFGVERTFTINYENDRIDVTNKTIPIWRLKLDDNYVRSNIIDPSQVTNNFLTTAELFAKDPEWYGHGSPTDPQSITKIKRYALTDLDQETYYIVEGVLKTENEFETDDNGKRLNSGRGKGGRGWYRLPHAIGATGVFTRLLIDIGVKLVPKITKTINLYTNPPKYVTDIIADKLKNNFEFLSEEAINTFQKAAQIKDQIGSQTQGIENIEKTIDETRANAYTTSNKLVAEARTDIELEQAKKNSKDIQAKAEEKVNKLRQIVNKKKILVKKLKDFYKDSILSNYVYLDEKSLQSIFVLDGGANIPFIGGLKFGMASNMADVPNKPPLKLIFPDSNNVFKNVQYFIDNRKRPAVNLNQPANTSIDNEKIDLIKVSSQQVPAKVPFANKTINFNEDINKVQIKFEDGSIKYIDNDSLQNFVLENQSKYNFIYVTEELNRTLVEVDELLQNGSQDSLDKAKVKLDEAKRSFPNNSAIDDKINELNQKNNFLSKNTQPLLKAILSIVTFPLKLVLKILKWLLDFFQSLTNPLTLASKMKEFLSFKWIMQFFKADDILKMFSVSFKPPTLISYAAIAATAKGKYKANSGGKADLSKYISADPVPTLPTYTADQYKNLLKGRQPLRLTIIFEMLKKFINGVIDFIWSLFGIEALIKPPHVKGLSNGSIDANSSGSTNSEDVMSIINRIEPKGASDNPILQSFIYEVKLPDGETKTFLDRDQLDKFIEENADLAFDFTF